MLESICKIIQWVLYTDLKAQIAVQPRFCLHSHDTQICTPKTGALWILKSMAQSLNLRNCRNTGMYGIEKERAMSVL